MLTAPGGGGGVPRRPAAKPVVHHAVLTAAYVKPKPVNRKIPAKYKPRAKPSPRPHSSFTLPALGKLPNPRTPIATPVSSVSYGALQKQAVSAKPAPAAPKPVSPYANPLRGVQGLQLGRIDQGVDYFGQGGSPVYSIGAAKVLRVSDPARPSTSWPGGGLIAYQLTSGPAKGTSVYVAEDIAPTVAVGQTVNKNTVIGRINQLGYIETGLTTAGQPGTPVAPFGGPYPTAAGTAFGKFLASLGAGVKGISAMQPVKGHVSVPPAPTPPHLTPGPILGTPIAGGGHGGDRLPPVKEPKLRGPGPRFKIQTGPLTPFRSGVKLKSFPPAGKPVPGGTSTTGTTGSITSKTVKLPGSVLGAGGSIGNTGPNPSPGSGSATTLLLLGGGALIVIFLIMHKKGGKPKALKGMK